MTKRRRKKENPVEAAIGAVLILSFLGGYKLTGSLIGGGVGAGIGIGIIIFIKVLIQQRKNDRLRKSGIQDIDKMEGRQFEHYLALLFASQGYKTEVTPASKDFGADLILKKENRKIAVQAKRHSSPIGVSAVQEAHASVPYYGASEAWVVSNQEFTQPAIALAKTNGVTLIGRKAFIDMVLKMNPGGAAVNPKKVIAEVPYSPQKCTCGQPMVIRKGPRGEFWGCSSYPRCRNVKPIVK